MLVFPAVADSSPLQVVSLSAPSGLNVVPSPFDYLPPYIFRSWHKYHFLREASPTSLPTNLHDDSSVIFLMIPLLFFFPTAPFLYNTNVFVSMWIFK